MTRMCLTLLAVTFFLATPATIHAVTIAEWDFSEGSGTAANSSVGGYTGNLVGFADTTAGAGDPIGGSGWTSDGRLNFDAGGVSTHVETTFPYSTLVGSSFTVEYIAEHNNGAQNWSPFIGQSGGCCFFFGKTTGAPRIHVNFNGLDGYDSYLVPVADGNPHHIAVVFDDATDTLTTYFDHQVVGSGAAGGTLNAAAVANLWLGGVAHQPTAEQWNGKVDHVRISNTALSRDQLLGTAPPIPNPVLVGLGEPMPGDPRLKAWYKADDGVVLNGNNVTQWIDRSVVTPDPNRDLFSTDLTHAPTFKAGEGTLANRPAVSFDGGLQFLQRQSGNDPGRGNSPVLGNSDRTVFVVLSNSVPRPATNNIEHVLHFGNAATDESYGVLVRAAGTNYGNHYWGGIDGGTTASTPDATAVTFVYDNDGVGGATGLDSFLVNGAPAGTIDVAATNTVTNGVMKTGTSEFKVGARIGLDGSGNPVEHFQGDIAEIIIYDAQLTQDQINQVHGYLQLKYGIQIENAVTIPEPASIALSLLGLTGIGLVAVRRRRRR